MPAIDLKSSSIESEVFCMGAKPDRSELKTYMPMPDLKDEFWLRVKLPIAKRRHRHHLWKVIHDVSETRNLWRFAQVLNDPDIRSMPSWRGIALSAAADVGALPMVKHVLTQSGKLDLQYVQSAMRSAVRHNDVTMLRLLLDHTDHQSKPDHLWQNIEHAAIYARGGFIQDMIKRGFMPQPKVTEKLLTGMILHQDAKTVDMLLSGGDVLPTLSHLSKALEKQNPVILQRLIEAGADCQLLAKRIRIQENKMYLQLPEQSERAFSLRSSKELRTCLRHLKRQIQKEEYVIENHEMPKDMMEISVKQARKNDGALLSEIALSGRLMDWMRHRAKHGEFLAARDFQRREPKTGITIMGIVGYKKQISKLFKPKNWINNLQAMEDAYQCSILLQHKAVLDQGCFEKNRKQADHLTLQDNNREKIKNYSRDSITIKRRPK